MVEIKEVWSRANVYERICFFVAIAFLIGTLINFTNVVTQVSDPVLRSDHYRVLEKGLPFFEGNLFYLPKVEGILYSLHTMAVLSFFGGDYSWSIFIIVCVFAMVSFLFFRSKSVEKTLGLISVSILLFSIYLISPTVTTLQWPLVFTNFSYNIILALILAYFANKAYTNTSFKSLSLLFVISVVCVLIYDRSLILLIPTWGLLIAYKLPIKILRIAIVIGIIASVCLYQFLSQSDLNIYSLLSKLGQGILESSFVSVRKETLWHYALVGLTPIIIGLIFTLKRSNFIGVVLLFSFLISVVGIFELRGHYGPRHLIVFRALSLSAIFLLLAYMFNSKRLSRLPASLALILIISFGIFGNIKMYDSIDFWATYIKRFEEGRALATYLRAQNDSEVGNFTLKRLTAGKNQKRRQKIVLGFLERRQKNVFHPSHLKSEFIPTHNRVKNEIKSYENLISKTYSVTGTKCVDVKTMGSNAHFQISGNNKTKNAFFVQIRKNTERSGIFYPIPMGTINYFGEIKDKGSYKVCPFKWQGEVSLDLKIFSDQRF